MEYAASFFEGRGSKWNYDSLKNFNQISTPVQHHLQRVEVTDLPAVHQGKERGHGSVVTGKVTEAAVVVEVPQVVSEERRVELLESTVLSSVVDVVVLAVEVVAASEAVPPVPLQTNVMERIYERLEAMDSATAEMRTAQILDGLGFTKKMQNKKTRDFSGGWRMRIALARALFMNPTILLLDEPTNHLDLEACVWLEEALKKFERVSPIVSHSQGFLNGVCTNIIHMQNKQLKFYSGNYDQFCQYLLAAGGICLPM